MNPIIPVPVDAQGEIVELRTLHSKTFDMGGRRRRLISRIELPHYVDPMTGRLEDVDTAIVEEATRFSVSKAWYDLTVPSNPSTPTPVALSYTSKRGGAVTVALVALDDTPISQLSLILSPRIRGSELWWDNVRPGLDIILSARPANIELYKRLRTPSAPTRFTWEITTTPGHTSFQRQTFARDNSEAADPSRGKREARVITTITGPSPDSGRDLYFYREEVTLETIVEDPQTRIRSLRPPSEMVYPIIVDVQVLEDIVANNDDGHYRQAYADWSDAANIYAANGRQPGWRFLTVAVPAGATIDAPTELSYRISSAAAVTGSLYGYDVDTAPAWSNSIHPGNMVKTAAGVTFVCTPTGWTTLNVQAIVQEIIDRPGWASGNNMAFGVGGLGGEAVGNIFAYNYSPPNSANLEINYTEASGATWPGWMSSRGGWS